MKIYILDVNNNVVEESDFIKGAIWKGINHKQCRVAYDFIEGHSVSTVFIGFDQNWLGKIPHVFETLYDSPDEYEGKMTYATWDEAVIGHKKICDELKSRLRSN